jgi:hypothetical protein
MPERQMEDFWTSPRRELRAWFERNAPSLGELYEGALRLLFMGNFPGRTRFVAHAVREIRNRLPDVISGVKMGGTVQYVNQLDIISNNWQNAGFLVDGTIPASLFTENGTPSADIPVPRILFEKIVLLIKNHVAAREKPEETAFRLFEGIAPENEEMRDTLRPIVRQWLDVTNWFQKKVHDSGAQDNSIDGKEYLRYFELFEGTLGALVRGFFRTVEGLDEILEDANA